MECRVKSVMLLDGVMGPEPKRVSVAVMRDVALPQEVAKDVTQDLPEAKGGAALACLDACWHAAGYTEQLRGCQSVAADPSRAECAVDAGVPVGPFLCATQQSSSSSSSSKGASRCMLFDASAVQGAFQKDDSLAVQLASDSSVMFFGLAETVGSGAAAAAASGRLYQSGDCDGECPMHDNAHGPVCRRV